MVVFNKTQPSKVFHLLELVWPDVAELILKEIKLKSYNTTYGHIHFGLQCLTCARQLVYQRFHIRFFLHFSVTRISQSALL